MTRTEQRIRRRLLEEISFDRIRPHITGTSGVGRQDVNYITSQVIHRVRKIVDYEGRQLGKRGKCAYCGKVKMLQSGKGHMLSAHCRDCCSRKGRYPCTDASFSPKVS